MTDLICCFCGLAVHASRAVRIALTFPDPLDEGQDLACHAACLLGRLEPGIPVHPALEDLSDA
jgi:hypothetical protein